jgi:hypothetical protein
LWNGDFELPDVTFRTAPTAFRVAWLFGGSTVAVAADPPEVGPGGRALSPSNTWTFSTGSPVVSENHLREERVGAR